MTTTYTYACKDYPGMEACPGQFVAETKDELWQLMALHAQIAHQEDPSAWSKDEIAQAKALIKTA
ncbi:MAG: DUF1059 domain-containing protein [Pseudomonadota bacterium]